MNYKLVYEVTNLNISFAWVLPFVMLIFVFLFPKLYVSANIQNSNERYNSPQTISIVRKGSMLFAAALTLFCIVFSVIFVIEYKNIVTPYKTGQYQVVAGSVEDYIPMPYEGRDHKESFSINNVHFEYSDYEARLGYNHSASHGGIISRNGQKVKIGYVSYHGKNVIVRIETD